VSTPVATSRRRYRAGRHRTGGVNNLTVLAAAQLAQLAEQIVSLQDQIALLHDELERSENRGRDLTDAKFVTYRTLIDSQADKVKLALEATEKAIEKAEKATEKAIDKAEIANNNRFEAVNEFRAQLTDLIARFATLERVDLLYNQTRLRIDEVNNNLSTRITELSTRMTAMESERKGGVDQRTAIFAIVFLVIAVFGFWTATH